MNNNNSYCRIVSETKIPWYSVLITSQFISSGILTIVNANYSLKL